MLIVDLSKLPTEEHEVARSIQIGLLALKSNVAAFSASLDLYIYAHERKMGRPEGYDSWRMISWINLAGTNGAIAAASFVTTLHYLASLDGAEIKRRWDPAEYKAAKTLIKTKMPGIKGVRASAAHPGEWLADVKESAKHALREEVEAPGGALFGSGVSVSGGMHALRDRLNFSATYAGQLESYELSAENVAVLDNALKHMVAAYLPLSV